MELPKDWKIFELGRRQNELKFSYNGSSTVLVAMLYSNEIKLPRLEIKMVGLLNSESEISYHSHGIQERGLQWQEPPEFHDKFWCTKNIHIWFNDYRFKIIMSDSEGEKSTFLACDLPAEIHRRKFTYIGISSYYSRTRRTRQVHFTGDRNSSIQFWNIF